MTEKEQKLYEDRLKALETLKKHGIDPYPASANRSHTAAEALELFDKSGFENKTVSVVGRMVARRGHGNLIFANLRDESGDIQLVFKADEIGGDKLKMLVNFHAGDFLEASGSLYKTRTGQKSVLVKEFKILAKSLRALPEKFHGLKDTETRLRKRYLDILANPEVRELFRKKSVFWTAIREFLVEKGFLEVQTPVLENIPGGADSEPFITYHNALGRDFYLRISLELPLKRLLVGGYEKVFEIGRLFRNEGIDREHLQEYDDMEFYMAYGNEQDGMDLAEEMFKTIVKKVAGGTKAAFGGKEIEWGGKWPKVDYFDAFKKEAGIELGKCSVEDLRKKAKELDVELEKTLGRGRLIDAIYKKTVRKTLVHPCFLVGHPIELSPLSKRDPKNKNRVLRFQVVAAGTELGNGFAELNDPVDQRERFLQQMKLREAGDKEAQMLDEDFVEALEYGMPPAVGFGMSERLFSVLMDKSIRETVIFPPMKKADES